MDVGVGGGEGGTYWETGIDIYTLPYVSFGQREPVIMLRKPGSVLLDDLDG